MMDTEISLKNSKSKRLKKFLNKFVNPKNSSRTIFLIGSRKVLRRKFGGIKF